MSEIKVNSIKGVAASVAALSINNTDGTCTANLTNRTNKNLIIGGAMNVAQRGTSSTSNGYQTVDRFNVTDAGVDEATTKAQVDVASGTSPYTLGFRKALKITNGNQTSGAGTDDYVQIFTRIEGQDLATSGWNYTSSSSFITLSFWIKSSVAQAFSGSLRSSDGTSQSFKFDTPSLSADTWTKVTKTILGNSNLTINNDNGIGMQVLLYAFIGTTYTTANSDTETWVTAGGNYANDMTSTWYTTNDATLELTGFQLEVGSFSSDFEFRSFAQELALCQRYYFKFEPDDAGDTDSFCFAGKGAGDSGVDYNFILPQPLRASPTISLNASGGNVRATRGTSGTSYSTTTPTVNGFNIHYPYVCLRQTGHSSMSDGVVSMVSLSSTGISIEFSSEL